MHIHGILLHTYMTMHSQSYLCTLTLKLFCGWDCVNHQDGSAREVGQLFFSVEQLSEQFKIRSFVTTLAYAVHDDREGCILELCMCIMP